ncbi:NAD-binding Rossmann-fold enzyme [Deinococcus aerius]|uniref:Putative gluconeogenesis factor n=1 Tax=Deinococcus aerius TaxID=200253 RepID=A0A2I9DHP8_9DEIO|nr:uridine diphosphate-N-acetylglucosamine-binding protein YvcK [Deinococcus aerius]GBF04221.1 NAD-binding Rossmann-fold enzyme [Deinococcus aerius]
MSGARRGRTAAMRAGGRRARMWLTPGMGVKRWLVLFVLCTLIGAVGFLHFTWTGPLHFVATRWILWLNALTEPNIMPLYGVGMAVMALALGGAFLSIVMLNRSMLRSTGTAPENALDVIYSNRTLSRGPRIVAVGGGTGLSNLLSGLKVHTANITAVVTVADDGGSSGRLRESLDMIAPGDLTDCYAALSDSPVLARLLLHRFGRGEGLEGHTFGNLLLATLSEEQGGLQGAMRDIHEVLRVRGQVFPATTRPATIITRLSDGREVRGESELSRQVGQARVIDVRLDPPDLPALPAVLEAIREAELIVLGPGSLFTSILPALLVPDIARAVRESGTPVVYVASLMTEPGETTGLSLEDHVNAITEHLGRAPNWVLTNSTPIPPDVQARYAAEGAQVLDLRGASPDLRDRVRTAPLLQAGQTARHDPAALAQALLAMIAWMRSAA